MARALRLNPVALRRAIYADGWLGGYRRAVRRALDAQVRSVAARAAAGEQVVIDDAEVERWAAELDRAKRDRVHGMVRDGFALAGREFPAPAKALGRSPGPDTPMSIAVGEGEEFLIRADFKDVDQWVETTSLSESRTSAKRLDKLFTAASRSVKKDAEGRIRGRTPKEIAEAILRRGLADNRARADMLAQTGTIWAFNEGAQQRYKAEGVTVEEWMVTADDVTCQYCMRMDGRRVRVDESFMSAGESMTTESPTGKPQTLSMPFDVQHPPLHPRCRCTMVPVLPELPRRVVAPTAAKPSPAPAKPKPVPTWSPSMSINDVKLWNKASKIKGPIYHGTSTERAQKLRKDGFAFTTRTGGRMLGDGVYVTKSKQQAAFWAEKLKERGEVVVELRVNVKRIKTMTFKEYANVMDTHMERVFPPGKPRGTYEQFMRKMSVERANYFTRRGYDAIRVTPPKRKADERFLNWMYTYGGNQTIVFDPKNVTAVIR